MFRLLIVDDEAIIADGICEVLKNTRELDLDVYAVYSGMEALKMMDISRIDIVISDIHMPEMDGFQLLENIRSRWPNARVIFLSGYSEFDYVYNAIHYDNVKYLLKTERYDKIIETVSEVVSEIESSLKREALIQSAEKQEAEYKGLLKDSFLNNLLKGRFYSQEISQKQIDQLEIDLNADEPVILLIGHIDNIPTSMPYTQKLHYLFKVRATANYFFENQLRAASCVDESLNIIWLIQPSIGKSTQSCVTFVKGHVELIQESCKESFDIQVSFVFQEEGAGWHILQEQYMDLKMALNFRFGSDNGMVLSSSKVMEERLKSIPDMFKLATAFQRSSYENLSEALEYGKRDDFFVFFEEVAERLKNIRSIHDYTALEQYYAIAMVLLSYINRWHLIDKVALRIGLYKLLKFDEFENWSSAVVYLREISEILFEIQEENRQERTYDVIGTLQKYISDNLHCQDEISLVNLADIVHFNPSYLSRLFKQEVGLTLSDYIGNEKIKKAKELLKDPNVKINTIAEQTGFGVAANFTRFFKKLTNMTPREYRSMCLENN